MVVVLIIALLVAIAIPTFLGARRRAQETQGKSILRSALVVEKVYYADAGEYTASTPDLETINSPLAWGNSDAGASGVVVDDVSTDAGAQGQGVVLKSLSRSGTMFCIADVTRDFWYTYAGVSQAGTYYGRVEDASAATKCDSATVIWNLSAAGWK